MSENDKRGRVGPLGQSLKGLIALSEPPENMIKDLDIDKIRAEAREEGRQEGLAEILKWLEDAFLHDAGRPDKGTPKYDAIIEVSRAAGRHLKKQLTGARLRD